MVFIEHKYITNFSRNNFKIPKLILKSTTFVISTRGLEYSLSDTIKTVENLSAFQSTDEKVMLHNEMSYFLFLSYTLKSTLLLRMLNISAFFFTLLIVQLTYLYLDASYLFVQFY